MRPLTRNSLGQKATQLLRKMLLDGNFAQGQRLVEDRIATELGISRTPLREALHRLAQEGLLEKRPRGGYVIRPLKRTEVEDALTIRSMLESHAASLAAQRSTDEQKASLQDNVDTFEKFCDAEDIPQLVELNEAFHLLLRECAHSPLLQQLLHELDGITERMLRPIISAVDAQWTHKDHARIATCIAKADIEGARKAMADHVLHGKKTIFTQFDNTSQE